MIELRLYITDAGDFSSFWGISNVAPRLKHFSGSVICSDVLGLIASLKVTPPLILNGAASPFPRFHWCVCSIPLSSRLSRSDARCLGRVGGSVFITAPKINAANLSLCHVAEAKDFQKLSVGLMFYPNTERKKKKVSFSSPILKPA